MKKLTLVAILQLCLLTVFTGFSSAKTLMLEGRIDGSVAMRQNIEFSVNRGTVSNFTFRFALPATYKSRTVSQSIEGLDANINPRPSSSSVTTDRFGNRFQTVTWNGVNQNIKISLQYTANVNSELSSMGSSTPFPIGQVGYEESQFLNATDMVQFNSSEISSLARQLTANAKNEHEAVTAITNWIADNIKYTFNPPQYDALYTVQTKSGNCQNFAHLSIALLRSLGIPARIVGGITLKNPWKVPIDSKNFIVQSMGQGGHAWLEVFFPDLGWLPYDPQQSKQFTSSRHIKQSHGLDSRDINDTWKGGPYLPAYSESIEGRFDQDKVNLKMKKFDVSPRPYLLSNIMAAASSVPSATRPLVEKAEPKPTRPLQQEPPVIKTRTKPVPQYTEKPVEPTVAPPPATGAGPAETTIVQENGEYLLTPEDQELLKPAKPVKPKKLVQKKPPKQPTSKTPASKQPVETVTTTPPQVVSKEPAHRKLKPGTGVVFGNMVFPETVNLYNVKGDTGTRVFERETSEYVTSKYIFAQAFYLKDRISLDKISLAMRKFGGDGAVYIDLLKDKDGLPDIMHGMRSDLHQLERISRKPGYYWVDFTFPIERNKYTQLAPGKYWIVVRASGEAIMNWFYIPGKPYSGGDDTRSTARGFQWEDILNFDFVFKVTGKAI